MGLAGSRLSQSHIMLGTDLEYSQLEAACIWTSTSWATKGVGKPTKFLGRFAVGEVGGSVGDSVGGSVGGSVVGVIVVVVPASIVVGSEVVVLVHADCMVAIC